MAIRRVTSVDVARQAGVSQSTVSLVFSGKAPGRISARTEAAVRAAAEELGYRPNAAARALKTGAARTVALVVPDITNPFFGGLLRGAQTAARAAGYAVALIDTNNDRDWGAASAEALRSGPADGLLLFEVDPPPRAAGAEPIVVIESESRGYPSVRLDAERGTDAAVRHLLELGHTRIGHVASVYDRPTFRLRRRAVDRLVGGAVPRIRSDFTLESARDAALELLTEHPELTALFCDDDIVAAGAYLAVRELGLRIPDDLSIVGFDGLDIGRVLDPPVTTVAADAEELGRVAFALLIAQLAGRRARSRVLAVELEVRGSTAAPR
ncbi:MAG TPA: LacI family DNA-binding transcriptional regulator [Solirubrobacteraceae bacterium]|nr:LacI family DNA-binding transcriptional regulator [Solirubrobacteraceae bacterium]